MEKSNRFIYTSPVDALSYIILFLLSILIPVVKSLQENPLSFFSLLFINSALIVREFGLLCQNKNITKSYWWKRLIGFFGSLGIATYCLIILTTTNVIMPNEIVQFCVVALICIPLSIALMELIMYLRIDYINQFDNKNQNESKKPEVKVVNSNTTDK